MGMSTKQFNTLRIYAESSFPVYYTLHTYIESNVHFIRIFHKRRLPIPVGCRFDKEKKMRKKNFLLKVFTGHMQINFERVQAQAA